MSVFNDECFECGSNEKIQQHHVVPKSKGGTKTIPLCESCHSLVHGKRMLKFQKLGKDAWERKIEKLKKKAKLEGKSLSYYGIGRPVGTVEGVNKFMSKPKSKEIQENLILSDFSIRKIADRVGCSTNLVMKVKKILENQNNT